MHIFCVLSKTAYYYGNIELFEYVLLALGNKLIKNSRAPFEVACWHLDVMVRALKFLSSMLLYTLKKKLRRLVGSVMKGLRGLEVAAVKSGLCA